MFEKYPTICHLPGSTMSRDDKRLDEKDIDILMNSSSLHVSEKVDGAIVGIKMQDNTPVLFKRSGVIGTGEHLQYQEFKSWVFANMDRVGQIPESWAVYGEWLSIHHTIPYNKLPEFFLAFDIMTPDGFLSIEDRDKYLNEFGFSSPKAIDELSLDFFAYNEYTIYQLTKLLQSLSKHASEYNDSILEGFVIRNTYNDVPKEDWLKAKWVRNDFIQGEHWSKTNIIHNTLGE